MKYPLRPESPDASSRHRAILRDSFGWDTATWSRSLALWGQHTSIELPAKALEVGATGNNGGLSLYLASRGFDVVWSGLEKPEPRARQLHVHYGVQDRISYEAIDVREVPYENDFDLIVFKSLLGGFGMASGDAWDAQQAALGQLRKALKPGGELWWVENAAGSRLHALLRRRFGWGKQGWHYLSANDVPRMFSTFDRVEYATFGICSAFGRTEGQRRLLAVMDRYLAEPISAPSRHYVVAGVARKAVQRT